MADVATIQVEVDWRKFRNELEDVIEHAFRKGFGASTPSWNGVLNDDYWNDKEGRYSDVVGEAAQDFIEEIWGEHD